MSELLALEWNSREMRVAVACGRGSRVVIEHAFSISGTKRSRPAISSSKAIGQRIAAELDRRDIGRPNALVAVGRTSIELRQLQLPPAPDEDLPDMVRFQAAREFNEFDEHWLLDFVPIDQGADGPRTVLATAIAPAVIRQIEGVCEAAGLKMQRLLLRPAPRRRCWPATRPNARAVAAVGRSALRRSRSDGGARRQGGFSADDAARRRCAPLAGPAGRDPPDDGRRAESIGRAKGADCRALRQRQDARRPGEVHQGRTGNARRIGRSLCRAWNWARRCAASLPEHPGRFAPLLGMLVAEFQQTGHAIDFLHPRRRLEAPSRRKKWIMAAAAAALAAAGLSRLCPHRQPPAGQRSCSGWRPSRSRWTQASPRPRRPAPPWRRSPNGPTAKPSGSISFIP